MILYGIHAGTATRVKTEKEGIKTYLCIYENLAYSRSSTINHGENDIDKAKI